MSRRNYRLVSLLAAAAGLAVGLALLTAPAQAGRPVEVPGLARALEAQEAHTDALLAMPGVVGTAVGLGGDGHAVVLVLLESAGVRGIPANLDGVAVRPLVTGPITAENHKPGHNPGGGGGGAATPTPTATPVPGTEPECDQMLGADPRLRWRYACMGFSIGHYAITAGSIGARVTNPTGNVYILSNNHVLANSNQGSVGDVVLQPGPYDGGTDPADRIGTLAAYVPIDFNGGDNRVDAALASVAPADVVGSTSLDSYGQAVGSGAEAALNMSVQKYGRTTKHTNGRVQGINVTVNVGYGGDRVAHFVGQILIGGGNFSAGGDSGSLIVGRGGAVDRQPVGLLFAGGSGFTVANPIGDVLDALGPGLTIVGQ